MSRLRAGWLALSAALVAGSAGGPVRRVLADPPPVPLDVWTWGLNGAGELGGVPPNATIPWPIHDVRDWAAIAVGPDYTVALTADGEVWTWGGNADGQLGTGTFVGSGLPVRVPALTGVTKVSAGGAHVLAYRAADETLWAWGGNAAGQLGRSSAELARSASPVEIPGLGALVAIAAGGAHSAVVTADGRVFTWGSNAYGQLGTGDNVDLSTPTELSLPEAATTIAAGSFHTVAVLGSEGAVWDWGWNVFAQLGRGFIGTPSTNEPVPAPASGLEGMVEVACGDFHTLARAGDGRVWSFGYNTEGQIGNGTDTAPGDPLLTPIVVHGLSGVTDIGAAGISSVALDASGQVWTWGSNRFGACGDNGRTDRREPARPLGVSGATAVAIGSSHVAAIAVARRTAAVTVVGTDGRSGNPPAVRPAVAPLSGLTDVAQASSGFRHTLAVDGEHRVWAWGDNSSGQLGVPGASGGAPVLVDLPLDAARGFVQVSARGDSSLALRSDGSVFAWGANDFGQLGLGSTDAQPTPARTPLRSIVAIALGERHGLALDRRGRVQAWGNNDQGQRGSPPGALPLAPAPIAGLSGLGTIAAGGFHSLALLDSGQLYAWGSGQLGQLGRLQRDHSGQPKLVAGMELVTSVSAGRYHTLAVTSGGAVFAIGDDSSCQHGIASALDLDATRVPGVPEALYAVAGDYHSLVVSDAGETWGFGDDSGGQLGRPDFLRGHSDCEPEPVGHGAAVAAGLSNSTLEN